MTDTALLSQFAKTRGVAEIMVPRTLVPVDKMPVLGTGKIDHTGTKVLAETEIAAPVVARAAE